MSEFIAEAQILVRPNTAAFAAELKAQLDAIKIPPLPVLVIPNTTKFTALATEELAALTQTPVVVPVVAEVTSTGAAAAAATGAAFKEQAATTEAASQAAKKLTAQEKAEAAVEDALTAATAKYNEANRIRLTEDTARVALARQLRDADAGLLALDKAQSSVATANNAQLRKNFAARAAQLQQRKQEIKDSIQVIDAAESERKVQDQIGAARRKAVVAQQDVIGATSAVAATTRQLSLAQQAAKASEDALAAARKVGTAAQIEEAEAVNAYNAALVEQAVINKRAAASQADLASRTAFAARGFGSAALQAAGLRGATLAANAAFIAGAVAAISFGKAVKSAAEFASQLNTFSVVAGATAQQMKAVSAQAEALGSDLTLPGVTAGDAAEAMTNLSKAGLTVQDSLAGARGVLQLATAAQIDNAEATTLAASALNAFGLAGDQAVHVADVLTNAANLSQGSIEDVGISLQQAAAVAHQVGISFEDTVNFITQLGRAGIKGSDAGTSLRVAFTRLINPTEKAAKILDRFNIKLRDTQGRLRPQVFTEFAAAQSHLTKRQQDANAAVVFGTDALRAYSVISRNAASTFTDVADGLSKQGSAAKVAGARMTGLTGQVANLSNQMSNLGLEVGKLTVGPLAALAKKLADDTKATADLLKLLGKVPGLVAKTVTGQQDQSGFDKTVGDFAKRVAGIATTSLPKALVETINQIKKTHDEIEAAGKFDTTEHSLGEIIKEFQSARKDGFDPFLHGITQAQATIDKTVQSLAALGPGGLRRLGQILKGITPLAQIFFDGVVTSEEKATLQTTELGQILARALVGTNVQSGTAKIKSGIEGVTAAIEDSTATLIDASRKGIGNLGPVIASNIEDAAREGVRSADSEIPKVGDSLADNLRAAFFKAIAQANKSGQELEDAMNQAIIAGAGPAQIKGILQKQFANQQKIIDAANARLAALGRKQTPEAKKARARARKERSAALEEQAGISGDIKSRNKEIADNIKKARTEADQNLLDALSAGRTPVSQRLARAQASPGARDNIEALKAVRKRLEFERNQVATGIKDIKTRTKELQRLDGELFQNNLDLQAARRDRNEALAQMLQDKGVALVSRGEATGNFRLILRGLDDQIAAAKTALVKAKALRVGVEAARAALAQANKTRRDTINEQRENLLEAAFNLEEARGNKSAMLQIIDLQIAQSKAEEKQAHNLLERLTAQIKTQELINKRKEILTSEAEKGTQGTTAFDLLKQFAEQFNQVAGSLISPDQPFAGPSGFTADIAQFLRRRSGFGGTGTGRITDPFDLKQGFTSRAKQQDDTTRTLIAALDNLAKVIQSEGGNRSTATRSSGFGTGASLGRPWFNEAASARAAQEG